MQKKLKCFLNHLSSLFRHQLTYENAVHLRTCGLIIFYFFTCNYPGNHKTARNIIMNISHRLVKLCLQLDTVSKLFITAPFIREIIKLNWSFHLNSTILKYASKKEFLETRSPHNSLWETPTVPIIQSRVPQCWTKNLGSAGSRQTFLLLQCHTSQESHQYFFFIQDKGVAYPPSASQSALIAEACLAWPSCSQRINMVALPSIKVSTRQSFVMTFITKDLVFKQLR
jgi:hypothetical protein